MAENKSEHQYLGILKNIVFRFPVPTIQEKTEVELGLNADFQKIPPRVELYLSSPPHWPRKTKQKTKKDMFKS